MNVSEVEEAEEQHPRQPLCSQSGRKLSCGVEEGRGVQVGKLSNVEQMLRTPGRANQRKDQ